MPHSDFLLGLLCRVTVAVDSGGTVVLVSQDGIQRPPFHFPKGGHLLQFLSCLENGLLPHGQLDPPLWSQRGKVSDGRGTGQLGEGGQPWAVVLLARGPSRGSMGACVPHRDPRAVPLGAGVSQGLCTGTCSFRAKSFLNCASEALRAPPSPRPQTRKTTRPRITCSGSCTPACSRSSVSRPALPLRPGSRLLAGPETD